MKFRKILFVLFSILFTSGATFGQVSSKIEWTSDTDLLPQNSVKSIVQDKYGYMWLTTENGLVRFDGMQYRTYNGQNLKTKSNRMLYIQGNAAKDSLYLSTEFDSDFLLIHQREVQKIDTTENAAFNLYRFTSKKIFRSHGIAQWDITLSEYYYKILLPSTNYYTVKIDRFQYFSKQNQLLKEFAYRNPKTTRIFTLGEKLFYIIDHKNYLVIANGKMKRYQFDITLDSDFQVIWNKPCEQVYIKSKAKLFQLDLNDSQLVGSFLLEDFSLNNLYINSVYNDTSNKMIFLGSSTNGLGIYKVPDFRTITVLDNKLSQVFYALAPLNKNQIITSTGFIMDAKTVVKGYDFITADKRGMAIDKESNIWIQKLNELYCYRKNENYQNPSVWSFKQFIAALHCDSSGKIWISLSANFDYQNRLVFFLPSTKPIFRNYLTSKNTINYMVNSLDGKLLLATTKGLLELDESKRVVRTIGGTSQLNIRSVSQTAKDELWISTYASGFYLHANNKTKGFPLDKNGYLATSHYLKEDAKGYMWIPTNKGLFQVTKKSLLAYFQKSKQNLYYHYYSKESGFLTNEFNGGASPFAAELGTQFFLPSMNGIVTFDTETIQPLEPKNPIYIDEITVDNLQTPTGTVLKLPNNYQRATFHFSTPYYGNPLNLNYEVMLDGPTRLGWTALNRDHNYSFTKLSSGTYTLTARMLTGFDSNYTYKKIKIEIAPYFYETTWFLLTAGLLLFMLVYGSIKLYFNQIRRRNQYLLSKIERKTKDLRETIGTLRATKDNMKKQADKNNKLIQIISHDIKSPLKFMSMASQYMYDDFDPNSPDLKENILALHTSSSQIYNFLDNVLSYSKVNAEDGALENDHFKLYDEIHEKIMFFKNIANSSKTELVNLVPEAILLHTNKSLFAIIIHNLLDNALKHTLNGTIAFSVNQQDDQVEITIKDTGTGMTAETLQYYQSVFDDFDVYKNKSNKRLGLHLVAELMLILNGKVILNSTLLIGTTIKLLFDNQMEKESS